MSDCKSLPENTRGLIMNFDRDYRWFIKLNFKTLELRVKIFSRFVKFLIKKKKESREKTKIENRLLSSFNWTLICRSMKSTHSSC